MLRIVTEWQCVIHLQSYQFLGLICYYTLTTQIILYWGSWDSVHNGGGREECQILSIHLWHEIRNLAKIWNFVCNHSIIIICKANYDCTIILQMRSLYLWQWVTKLRTAFPVLPHHHRQNKTGYQRTGLRKVWQHSCKFGILPIKGWLLLLFLRVAVQYAW